MIRRSLRNLVRPRDGGVMVRGSGVPRVDTVIPQPTQIAF